MTREILREHCLSHAVQHATRNKCTREPRNKCGTRSGPRPVPASALDFYSGHPYKISGEMT